MEDIERYSDYNEYEDDIPKGKKTPVMLILKILLALVAVAVIGIFAFRMIVYNYYPDTVKNILFTDALTEYYNETDGNICATTQNLRAPYDDPKAGNFFADNLIIIEGIDEIQLSVRFNNALIDTLNEKHGTSLTTDDLSAFSFKLSRNHESEDNVFVPIGTLVAQKSESKYMYQYFKLVFDEVDLEQGGTNEVKWLALEIYVEGIDKPFRIAIYENNSEHSKFSEYTLSNEEKPQ
jgi:hypothetical protein